VINALDARLCKAMVRGYPNITAAAIIEKHRAQVPGCNVPPAEAVKKVGQPEPLDKSDVEQHVVVRKGEPITDPKGAAKARKKAIKAKRKSRTGPSFSTGWLSSSLGSPWLKQDV
jgi:hypothetical protein